MVSCVENDDLTRKCRKVRCVIAVTKMYSFDHCCCRWWWWWWWWCTPLDAAVKPDTAVVNSDSQ